MQWRRYLSFCGEGLLLRTLALFFCLRMEGSKDTSNNKIWNCLIVTLPISPKAGQRLIENQYEGQQWQLQRWDTLSLGSEEECRTGSLVCRAGGSWGPTCVSRAQCSQHWCPHWTGFMIFDWGCWSACHIIDDFPCLPLSHWDCKLLNSLSIHFFCCFSGLESVHDVCN